MNHADVKLVEEVRTSYEVNRFIDLGWVLLQVFPGIGYQPQDKWPFYIMGWVKEDKVKYPPN
jgi:hypothetical protein